MQLHPWLIASWPIIERVVDPTIGIANEFEHLGTTVSGDYDDFGRFLGHTFWGISDSTVGIAWDWVEATDGVFAMLDPMGVVSNIGFVDAAGSSVPDFIAAVQLNRITHALPWQLQVSSLTSEQRASNPWTSRVKKSREKAQRNERRHSDTADPFLSVSLTLDGRPRQGALERFLHS
ncbi:MAG: hypothetical protein M3Y27_29955 [Acidobacteriota bacterium]|nr:hypothetical protein [Acidobacteriota bacterium]